MRHSTAFMDSGHVDPFATRFAAGEGGAKALDFSYFFLLHACTNVPPA